MATIERYRVAWTGFTGSPGVSTFYYFGSIDPASALRTMFNAIGVYLPISVRLSFPTSGDTIDDTTGKVNGTFSASSVSDVVGQDAGVFAAPVGALLRWRTGTVINGRKVRGETFIVPLVASAFQTDGSLGSTPLAALQAAVTTYVGTAAGLAQVIYRRPGSVGGAGHVAVTGGTVPDKAVVLRSRRD